MTGSSTIRRVALVLGLLALVFAPRLGHLGDVAADPASDAHDVGAAMLAPTFWSDGVAPARASDDVDAAAPLFAFGVVAIAVAALTPSGVVVQPRRRPHDQLLLAAPRWRGPPVETSTTSIDHQEEQWKQPRSTRTDPSTAERARSSSSPSSRSSASRSRWQPA